MPELMLQLLLVAMLSSPLWWALSVAGSAVPVVRVHRFAGRHTLVLTPGNGRHIVTYLAVTKRWRAFGLAVGIIISVVSGLPDRITISSLPLFSGWFAGALIAEVCLLPSTFGPRRAALLTPRRLSHYLPATGRLALPAAAALAVIAGLLSPHKTWPWTLAAVAVAAVAWIIQRRVLGRAQPAGDPDIIAADDAVRSRSLHVLSGGGAALTVFTALAGLERLGITGIASLFIFILTAIAGWVIATSSWQVARAA